MDIRETFTLGTVNKSDIYILPMLVESEAALRNTSMFPQNCFVNTFLGDRSNTEPEFKEGKIMLLYRLPKQTATNVTVWNNFETFLMGLPTYIGDFKADKYHRMFVYDVPEMWREDYAKFLAWRPSQFSEMYKQRIRRFYGNLTNNQPIMQVLHKAEERYLELEKLVGAPVPRDLEASSAPYWDEEYYQDRFKVLTAIQNGTESIN